MDRLIAGGLTVSGGLTANTATVTGTATVGAGLSAATVNNVTITPPTTGSTLTIDNGKTSRSSSTLTFTGTDGTSFAFPSLNDTIMGLAATQTVTGGKTFTGALNAGNGTGAPVIGISGAAGQARTLGFYTAGANRWQLIAQSNAESGGNGGSNIALAAYTDAGTFSGFAFDGVRASGPPGLGAPYFGGMAPFVQTAPRATAPGGVIGNDMEFPGTGSGSDAQPMVTLGANPLSVTNLSPVVTVNWPSCCGSVAPISPTQET